MIIDQSSGLDAGPGNTITAMVQYFHEAGRLKCVRAIGVPGQVMPFQEEVKITASDL